MERDKYKTKPAMQKTFVAESHEKMDKLANDFRRDNNKFEFVGTQINLKDDKWIVTVFYKEWM